MVYLAVESNSLVRVESVHRLVASQIQLAFHCVNRCELYIEIFLLSDIHKKTSFNAKVKWKNLLLQNLRKQEEDNN